MYHSGVILWAKSLELVQGVTVLVTEFAPKELVVSLAQPIHDMGWDHGNRAFTDKSCYIQGEVDPLCSRVALASSFENQGTEQGSWTCRAQRTIPGGLTNLSKAAQGSWARSGPGLWSSVLWSQIQHTD